MVEVFISGIIPVKLCTPILNMAKHSHKSLPRVIFSYTESVVVVRLDQHVGFSLEYDFNPCSDVAGNINSNRLSITTLTLNI